LRCSVELAVQLVVLRGEERDLVLRHLGREERQALLRQLEAHEQVALAVS
jgi:hypothetical protein